MLKIFSAQYSILACDVLADYLLTHYDLDAPALCQLWQRGDNDLYLITAKQTQYFLRVYKRGEDREAIQAGMIIQELFYKKGIPLPRPIKDREGGHVQVLQAPEGTRYAVLHAFVPGKAPGFAISPEQSYLYGKVVASMHECADELPLIYAIPTLDFHYLLDEPAKLILPFLQQRPEHAACLQDLIESLKLKINAFALPTTVPAHGFCHGDLHKTNLLCTAENQLTIIDFDCLGYGWRAYELAVLLWSTAFNGMQIDQAKSIWGAYLKGYNESRYLSEPEMMAIPYFVPIRMIYIMSVHVAHVLNGEWGVGALTDRYFDGKIERLKWWMSEYCAIEKWNG